MPHTNHDQNGPEKFLIVEDSFVSNQILFGLIQSLWQVSATIADSGEKAFLSCLQTHYQVIFIDLVLPDQNGFDVAGVIAEHYEQNQLELPCIIGISASTQVLLVEHHLSAEKFTRYFRGFIEKPFTLEKLKSIAPIIHNTVSGASNTQLHFSSTPVVTISALIQKIPEIDLKELFERLDENFYFLVHLLSFFYQDCLETKKSILVFAEKENWLGLKDILSTLKGTSKNLFCREISDICQVVETSIQNNTKYIDEEICFLMAKLEHLCQTLEEFLKTHAVQKIDKKINQALFNSDSELLSLIGKQLWLNDAEVEHYLSYFLHQFEHSTSHALLARLQIEAITYDFSQARETYQLIAASFPAVFFPITPETHLKTQSFSLMKPTLLLVEDTLTCIKLLVNFLEKDYSLRIAKDGDEALRVARLLPQPDLMLLDVNLPGANGYTICQILKRDTHTSHIPVIFLTSNETKEEELYGFKVGGVDYVTKPFSMPVLLARIETHLKLRRYQRILEQQVKMDALTGLGNREGLKALIDLRWRDALRKGVPLGLFMLDLDHFKLFNHTYDHMAGDEVLVNIAIVIREMAESVDGYAARYSGTTFVVVCPELLQQTICILAEKIRVRIEALAIAHAKNFPLQIVTVSIGISMIEPQRDLNHSEQLIQQAEQALLQAKANGRNQIYCAAELSK